MLLLKALNQDAKNWWVNSDLRKCGKDKQARQRERESTKMRLASELVQLEKEYNLVLELMQNEKQNANA